MSRSLNKKNKSKRNSCRLIKYIVIDPGKSGGIAMATSKGMLALKCPKEVAEMAALYEDLIQNTPHNSIKILIERVWARPTNGSRHAFAYGFNYGLWFGIIARSNVNLHMILPNNWMKYFGCPKGLEYSERKRWLKQKAKELYPNIKRITLDTADSILIAHYAKEEFFKKTNI